MKEENSLSTSENKIYPLNMKGRLIIATWVGKFLTRVLRLIKKGGTTLPGKIALKINPEIIELFSNQLSEGAIIITGTNGKTTSSSLLTTIINEAGLSSISNQSGSNMNWGIASTFLSAASWQAKLVADYGVIEADEGNFPGIVSKTKPRGIVITNIFRDQLDRYGEIDYIKSIVKKGVSSIPRQSFKVINADDPSLHGIIDDSQEATVFTYGLDLTTADQRDTVNTAKDLKICPFCHLELRYSVLYYAHLGHFYCPGCHFKRNRPNLSITAYKANADGSSIIDIDWNKLQYQVYFPLPGLYNLYNLMAAVTCAHILDIKVPVIQKAVKNVRPSFGRMEKFKHKGIEIVLALVKNPVGANEALNTLLVSKGSKNNTILVAINDNIPDGRDISWIWDVDFEQINRSGHRFSSVITSGIRALDTALRLKYAGVESNSISIESNPAKALKLSLDRLQEGACLIILPNYSAMLEIRRALNKMGIVKNYWEA